MAESECYFHGRENIDNPYLVCGECFHQYATAQEIEDLDFNWQIEALHQGLLATVELKHGPAEEIYACPLCAHDF